MKRKWFYIDITATYHERVAVKAEDEESAKDMAGALIDAGMIDVREDAVASAYGSGGESVVVGDPEPSRPPRAMRKFDGLRGEVK